MKKLIILAAIALTASVSQAYAISWGAINVKTPIATDVTVDQAGIVGSGAAMAGLAINLYWVDGDGKDVAIGTFNTGTGTSAGKVASTTIGNGTESDLYLAMVDAHGTSWKPTYHMTATYETADGVYTFDGTATAGKALSQLATAAIATTANFSTAGTWTYTANPVPEPTSAMLLLLGVAGLALRRRRA